jgi:hypothetical protein
VLDVAVGGFPPPLVDDADVSSLDVRVVSETLADTVESDVTSVVLVTVTVEASTADPDDSVELNTSEPEDDSPEVASEISDEDADEMSVTVVDSPSEDIWVGNESRKV